MIRLPALVKRGSGSSSAEGGRLSIRDRLLVGEVSELETTTPPTVALHFPSTSALHTFTLTVRPAEGPYSGGTFVFAVQVPPEYNDVPPLVRCTTRLWHPNISEEGEVCLSLLRRASIDALGWSPTRRLKDLVWGLNSLFTDLVDFDDPLNAPAANHFHSDPAAFQVKVKEYIRKYCV